METHNCGKVSKDFNKTMIIKYGTFDSGNKGAVIRNKRSLFNIIDLNIPINYCPFCGKKFK